MSASGAIAGAGNVLVIGGVGRCVAPPASRPHAHRNAPRHDLDDRLIERAQRGDFDAFGELIRRYQTNALRVAAVVLGTPDGADDILQEATERAWRAIARFHRGAAFRPWLLRIVANAARNERRSKGRRAHLAVRAAGAHAPEAVASAEDVVVGELERQRVVEALNRLGTEDRLTIGLRFFEQLSESEMAEILDCPTGTVKSRLSRAKDRLRVELERGGTENQEVTRHG